MGLTANLNWKCHCFVYILPLGMITSLSQTISSSVPDNWWTCLDIPLSPKFPKPYSKTRSNFAIMTTMTQEHRYRLLRFHVPTLKMLNEFFIVFAEQRKVLKSLKCIKEVGTTKRRRRKLFCSSRMLSYGILHLWVGGN